MRLFAAALLPAICTAKSLLDSTATVLLHHPHSEPKASRRLDPVAARLVLAQRLGVEDFHSADLQEEGVVDAINEYGVHTSLFPSSSRERGDMKHAFFLLEAPPNPYELSNAPIDSSTGFLIHPAPEPSAIRDLFVDLARQSRPHQYSPLSDEELYNELKDGQGRVPSHSHVFHIANSMHNFVGLYQSLVDGGEHIITAIVAPLAEAKGAPSTSVEWGTYEMPGTPSRLKQKRQQKEEPLTETQEFIPVNSTSTPITPFADSRPLRGILPSCFASQSACESATRNCTGHGQCRRKYHDSSAETNKDCFSCSCSVTESSDGRTTTHWGGPACQKKDVSVQFWLIALFTVGLVFLVGFAIGQVWDMGEQQLPSVIGAGVSGPSARK